MDKKQLDNLFKRIDEPVALPAAEDKFKLAPPPDIVPFVVGSVAGANSSDFHIYRGLRRKEYMRQEVLQAQLKEELDQEEFRKRTAAWRDAEEQRTAKKRAKRQKQKQKKQKSAAEDEHAVMESTGDDDADRILARNAALMAQRSEAKAGTDAAVAAGSGTSPEKQTTKSKAAALAPRPLMTEQDGSADEQQPVALAAVPVKPVRNIRIIEDDE